MIEINNLTTNLVDEGFLVKLAGKVLESEGRNKEDLSITLVGEGRMRRLNKRYRGKNRTTDVLAFENKDRSKFIMPPGQLLLGEIVICIPVLKKNARKFNSDFKRELSLTLIHGILHLLGYDHEKSEKEAEKMKIKQQYYLDRVIVK